MGYYTQNGGLIGTGAIDEPTGVYDIIASQMGIPITDYTPITNTSATGFTYFVMPSGPRTMVDYMSSFGISGSSSNDNTGSWPGGFDNLTATATPITTNDYFNSGSVSVIRGDGSVDAADWAVFYFKGQLGDFDGYNSNTGSAWFGSENTTSAATNGSTVTTGRIWGYEQATGWNLLYVINPMAGNNSYNHTNGNWFASGGTVPSGSGKYAAYDNLSITSFGFSVT